jgi:hypothetical protein
MDDAGQITCATYTHARRHPMVLGHIAGWTPPFQLSVTQILAIVAIFWIEMWTWHWWGGLLPRIPGVMIAIIIPCLVAWVVRRTRIEGRSLPRAAVGWLSLLWAPRQGRVSGRPHRELRAARVGAPIYVEGDASDLYGVGGGGTW